MNSNALHKVWLAVVLLVAAGCRHVSQESPPVAASSFSFVEAVPPPVPPPKTVVAAEAKEAAIFEDFREALPIYPLSNPVYPARRALRKKAGLACVGVRITVDVDGHVTDVLPSVAAFTTPGPFADDFFAAVATAVRQWRFRPAEIERVETVQATGLAPYSRVLSTEKAETHFDLAFTFTAAGTVLGAEPVK